MTRAIHVTNAARSSHTKATWSVMWSTCVQIKLAAPGNVRTAVKHSSTLAIYEDTWDLTQVCNIEKTSPSVVFRLFTVHYFPWDRRCRSVSLTSRHLGLFSAVSTPPLPTGILHSPQFSISPQETKVAADRTQRSKSTISRKIGDCEQSEDSDIYRTGLLVVPLGVNELF